MQVNCLAYFQKIVLARSVMRGRIGFLGLGLMGRPMALRLLRAGYPLTVWNRTISKADPLADEGAMVATCPAELAAQSDVIVSIVTGPEAVWDILCGKRGVVHGACPDTVVIDMSTIGLHAALACAKRCRKADLHFLDAPVTGSIPGAENGSLTVMVGGEQSIFERCLAILQVFGQPVHVGPQGMGALVKLVQNLMAAAIVEALAEGAHLAKSYGLDLSTVAQVLSTTGVDSVFLRAKAAKMVEEDFSVQFSLANMMKDLGLVLEAAQDGDVKLPVAKRLFDVYRKGVKSGLGEEDYAALLKAVGM